MRELTPPSTLARAIERLQRQVRPVRVAGLATVFAVVAYIEFWLDPDLSLYAFYLIPAIYSTWFLSVRWGYVTCVASSAVWLVDGWRLETFYHHPFISYWNLGMRAIALLVVVAIVNLLKTELEARHQMERQRVQDDLAIAREVQLRLLPSDPPSYPGLDLGYFYRPAQSVGGDYYDFIPLSSERLGIVVADVSGKGLPGALLMALLQGLVHNTTPLYEGEISEFVSALNASLYKRTTANRYATMFFGIVDTARLTFDYVSAGHDPPFLLRKDQLSAVTLEPLDHGGPPVGILPWSQYESERLDLRRGDVLVVYTDGVTDAQNLRQEEFGIERLRQTIEEALTLPAVEICKRVSDSLEAFTGDSPQTDDITLVVMKVGAPSISIG